MNAKRVLTLIVTLILFAVWAVPVSAATVSKEDYKAIYNEYKDYYENTYVPAYYAYNQVLEDLRAQIQNTKFETYEQAQRVIDFLKAIKTRRNAFFGDRETPGTSRYIVPRLREAMYAAEKAEDFQSAYAYCDQLIKAVQARVAILNSLANSLRDFEIIEDAKPNVSVVFKVNNKSDWWYDCTIVITNNSDQPLEAWTLQLSVDGHINYAGLTSGGYDGFGTFTYSSGYSYKFVNNVFSLSPQDKWQGGYVIPAGGSITFTGNGSRINGITGATIDGVPCSITFIQ